MVTVELLLLWRFKRGSPVGNIILPLQSGMQETQGRAAGGANYSAGTSKDICLLNQEVFHAP
jgi:hypothetical protein